MEKIALDIRNLSVSYGKNTVLKNLDLAVPKNRITAIIGGSGCGKSTLGRTIIHLYESTDGKILFDGRDITRISHSEIKTLREDIQMIFQDPFASLNPRMSVGQLIAEPLLIYGKMKGRELDRRVAELMDTVGLARRLSNSYPHELDGGRCQRIGVARALALNPKFIVCDEPVSSLDVSIQAQVINLMQDLQEELGLTYMFITHNMAVVRHMSDTIMVMYLGMMVEFADSEEMFRRRLHPYTQALLAAVPIPEVGEKKERKLIKGEITSPIDPPDECRFAKRCPYAKDICFAKTPAAEEVLPGHFVACHRARELNGL